MKLFNLDGPFPDAIIAVLLVDRILDRLTAAGNNPLATTQESDARGLKHLPAPEVVVITPQEVRVTVAERRASSF